MNKLVTVLAASTLACAAAAIYYRYELMRERAGGVRATAADAPAATSPDTAASPAAKTTIGPPPSSFRISKPVLGPDGQPDELRANARTWFEQQAPALREMLEDPQKRAEHMREYRNMLQGGTTRVPALLKLGDDEYQRLLDLLVQQDLRQKRWMVECAMNPACDPMPPSGYVHAQDDQEELVALLGPGKAQAYADYNDDFIERNAVLEMRGAQTDAVHMNDAQADQLIAALGEERRRIAREWEQRGASTSGTTSNLGSVSYSSASQDMEQRTAEARELQRRQRERAAQILTSAQLEDFTQRQQAALERARGAWEYEFEQNRQGN